MATEASTEIPNDTVGRSCSSVHNEWALRNALCYEVYIPRRQGSFMSNSFEMTFCQRTYADYLKCLFGMNGGYEYEDRVQYKLYKARHSNEPDLYVNSIYVEKNALHCQGLVKKILVVKDNRSKTLSKVMFVS